MEVYESVDWLSITFPVSVKISRLIPSWALSDKMEKVPSPIPIYKTCYELQPSGIKILLDGSELHGKHMIISGKPLANLRARGIVPENEIWDMTRELGGRVGRIDLAVDVLDTMNFTVSHVQNRNLMGECVTSLVGDKYIGEGGHVESFYIGNWKSRKRKFRVYDKGVEQGIKEYSWVRLEYEKRHRAHVTARQIFEGKHTPRQLIKAVVDFPEWGLWQEIFDCEAVKTMRGQAEIIDQSKLFWILNSAVPAIAKQIVQDSINYGTGLEDNPTLLAINARLSLELNKLLLKASDTITD